MLSICCFYRIYEKVNDRWEVCISMADGHHFEQVYNFVSSLWTVRAYK
jgi:hypothetical protein